jgi:hypothetical protein
MTCSRCKTKPVWKFTNQTQLCANCFCDYFERKILRTIRKLELLPSSREFILKKSDSLNTKVLIFILKKNFSVKFSNKSNIDDLCLSDFAESDFESVIAGKFGKKEKNKSPLGDLGDEEIELYAKLKKIKGKKKKRNQKIQSLFDKFRKKNQDLEHNVMNAWGQI